MVKTSTLVLVLLSSVAEFPHVNAIYERENLQARSPLGKDLQTHYTKNTSRHLQDQEYYECNEFVDHLTTITKYAGVPRPRRLPGYGRAACKRILKEFNKKPRHRDMVINLSYHIRSGGEMTADGLRHMKDIAGTRRRKLEPSSCDDADQDFRMGFPGPGSLATAHIFENICPDATCPTLGIPSTQPLTCIPPELIPDYDDNFFSAFEEFPPGYGGGGGYTAYVSTLDNPSLVDFDTNNEGLWTGCDQDRVGDYDGLSQLLETIHGVQIGELIADIICKIMPDDIEFWFVDLPNAGKVVCAIVVAAFKATVLAFEIIMDQVDFQNGLVDGAEIQASYFHTMNLLDKQCGIFYEAVCRCSEASSEGSFGTGCDGLDSNCDGTIDECDEDIVPPVIDLSQSETKCKNTWFATASDALECVSSTLYAKDDCNNVQDLVVERGSGSCEKSSIDISIEDDCGNASSDSLVVQIDDEQPPTVNCTVGGSSELVLETTGASVLEDIEFHYTANDGCGLSSIQIDVYSNEIEDFNAQNMAMIYEISTAADPGIFVAKSSCATASNGQCIQDPKTNIRLYWIIVTATDNAGNQNQNECTVKIIPTANKASIDTSASAQRFLMTSYVISV